MKNSILTVSMLTIGTQFSKWTIEILTHMMQFNRLSCLCINRRTPFFHQLSIRQSCFGVNIVHINVLNETFTTINFSLMEISILKDSFP